MISRASGLSSFPLLGELDALGASSSGVDPGLTALAPGVVLALFVVVAADGISSYSGSGPIFELGRVSEGWLWTLPAELPRMEELVVGTLELMDGPFRDGTVVVGAPTGSSVVMPDDGALEPPQVEQGAVTAAGLAKIGRYDLRLWLHPATPRTATISTATEHERIVRAEDTDKRGTDIRVLLARLKTRPTILIGA